MFTFYFTDEVSQTNMADVLDAIAAELSKREGKVASLLLIEVVISLLI